MKKAAIIKIAGFTLVPFLVMLIATYFLYPYLNEEKYEDIVDENSSEFGLPISKADSLDQLTADSLLAIGDSLGVLPDSLVTSDSVLISTTELEELRVENLKLKQHLDSLNIEFESISAENQTLLAEKEAIQEKRKLTNEEFIERVKSLLNLDEDELGPILEKMTNKQLVRLYEGGGTIQREKILRALNSDRAAELMTEVML